MNFPFGIIIRKYTFGLVFICSVQFIHSALENEDYILGSDHQTFNGTLSSLRLFNSFLEKYNKFYHTDFQKRYEIFSKNLKTIKRLQREEQGTAIYGITKFSDLNPAEFQKYLGYRKSRMTKKKPFRKVSLQFDGNLPDSFDWREHGVVTPVKFQGTCGSCWAFAAVANIESQWAIKKGRTVSLSEQQILDCDERGYGCRGGDVTDAFQYVIEQGGIEPDRYYMYSASDKNCSLDRSRIAAKISDYHILLSKDPFDLKETLRETGPLTAIMNAASLQHYKRGVFNPRPKNCNPNTLNHAVLIVGYGEEKSKGKILPYWIIKNSWGKDWGEKGYFKLYSGAPICGIDREISYTEVEH